MDNEKLEKIASVKFRAQEIKDHLQVYYWSNDEYHLKRAIEHLNELNKIDLEALCQKNITKND